MDEVSLLIEISGKLTDLTVHLDFYAGVLSGILIGLIFWNIVKEVG